MIRSRRIVVKAKVRYDPHVPPNRVHELEIDPGEVEATAPNPERYEEIFFMKSGRTILATSIIDCNGGKARS